LQPGCVPLAGRTVFKLVLGHDDACLLVIDAHAGEAPHGQGQQRAGVTEVGVGDHRYALKLRLVGDDDVEQRPVHVRAVLEATDEQSRQLGGAGGWWSSDCKSRSK
jgi:hypothetical protein